MNCQQIPKVEYLDIDSKSVNPDDPSRWFIQIGCFRQGKDGKRYTLENGKWKEIIIFSNT